MKNYILKYDKGIVEIEGKTNYDVSFQLGKLLKWGYKQSEKNLKEKIRNSSSLYYIQNLLKRIEKEYPFILEDLQGRADGAGIDIKTMLLNYCYEFQRKKNESCSSIIVHTKDNVILAHNEDGPYNEKRTLLIKVKQGNKEYYTIADSRCLTSSTIYIHKDFIFSMNSIDFDDYNLDYLPTYLHLRTLTECNNLDEVFEKIKEIPIAGSEGLNICDRKTGEMFYVEKILNEYEIRKIDGVLLHTNHVVFDKMKKYKPKKLSKTNNTLQRMLIMQELLNSRNNLNEKEVLEILQYYGTCDYNSVLSKQNSGYNCLTFGTYIFNFKENTSKIYVYNKQNSVFDLNLNQHLN